MSSGMNKAQAEEYAKTMTYKQAISNIWTAKGIMYRKATMIKLHELAEIADKLERDNDMTREEAIQILSTRDAHGVLCGYTSGVTEALDMAIEALSSDATKKKAELKENGDWDCPDVYCDECDHHRSVEWCSLAIPSHEEKIDDTYKMVTEAFFEGFDAAEEQYRLLIETIEELEKKSATMTEKGESHDRQNQTMRCSR